MPDANVHLPPNENDKWSCPKFNFPPNFWMTQSDLDSFYTLLNWLEGFQTGKGGSDIPGLWGVFMFWRRIVGVAQAAVNNTEVEFKSKDQLDIELQARIGRCVMCGWQFDFQPATGDGRPWMKFIPPGKTMWEKVKLAKDMPYLHRHDSGLGLLLDQCGAPNYFSEPKISDVSPNISLDE